MWSARKTAKVIVCWRQAIAVRQAQSLNQYRYIYGKEVVVYDTINEYRTAYHNLSLWRSSQTRWYLYPKVCV